MACEEKTDLKCYHIILRSILRHLAFAEKFEAKMLIFLRFVRAVGGNYLPAIHSDTDVTRDIPARYFGELDREYLMAFNIGAVWNVVFRWVRKGMTDSSESIKAVLMEYVYKTSRTDLSDPKQHYSMNFSKKA